jgi:DNA-directed RNA polymerase specialized sigma24 family protein
MSPLSLRRYRAERLLRRDFEALRASVLANVRGRLSASGMSLDRGDLDACYAQAWQGLYTAVLEGQEIESPAGWLTLVTFRRAIEEHRARSRADRGGAPHASGAGRPRAGAEVEMETPGEGGGECDLADELDDRRRLRELFEGMRGRLDGREREAATLCYLQGLSRSEAAARLGVSDRRMRKLMEGSGDGRPGVAGKVGALVETIRDGGWCEEQGSLMRALAYGILDPDGERYRLALAHHAGCPSCRAYVVSLRGLAATLPPVFLPGGLGFAILARGGAVHAGATAGSGAGLGGGVGHGAGSQAGRGIGGALPASGAAGAGGSAAGGGWLLAGGPLGTKLAAGCLLALGVGAGCVALGEGHQHGRSSSVRHRSAHVAGHDRAITEPLSAGTLKPALAGAGGGAAVTPSLTPAGRARREFGPERALASAASDATTGGAGTARARSASSPSSSQSPARSSSRASGTVTSTPRPSVDVSAAAREFSPG